jgi:hypothetical protein
VKPFEDKVLNCVIPNPGIAPTPSIACEGLPLKIVDKLLLILLPLPVNAERHVSVVKTDL